LQVCSICYVEKPLCEFYIRSETGKPRSNCKGCCNAASRKYHSENREACTNMQREYRSANLERLQAADRASSPARYQKDKIRIQARHKAWRASNKDKMAGYAAKHRAAKARACPEWLTEDQIWMMQEVYDLCELRTRVTGVPHHVDHIVPLQGKQVSGLHVPWNLRVLTARENQCKSNSFTS